MVDMLKGSSSVLGSAGKAILRHYTAGDSPAKAAEASFADSTMREDLRELMHDQTYELCSIASPSTKEIAEELGLSEYHRKLPKYLGGVVDHWQAHPSWREPLQQVLDERGISIEPFLEDRRAYEGLSDEEFYKQAVAYCYAVMEHGGPLMHEYYQWEFDEMTETEVARLNAIDPTSIEHVKQHLHLQGSLTCDLPEVYLDWMEKQSGR